MAGIMMVPQIGYHILRSFSKKSARTINREYLRRSSTRKGIASPSTKAAEATEIELGTMNGSSSINGEQEDDPAGHEREPMHHHHHLSVGRLLHQDKHLSNTDFLLHRSVQLERDQKRLEEKINSLMARNYES